MNIQHNVDLSRYTSFGFKQQAAHFVEVSSEPELNAAVQAAQNKHWPVLVLGSGSNVVLTQDFPGLLIRQIQDSISYQDTSAPGETHVTASAGVIWHDLVLDTIDRGLNGLENLSLIPGQVGAAPVQNIGAYGVELSDRLVSLRAFHRPTGQWQTLSSAECDFSYRNSRFKKNEDEYIISEITLSLGDHRPLNSEYRALADYLSEHYANQDASARTISEAVCAIRRSKLPAPEQLPNAGSFFHNPIVSATQHETLRGKFPDLIANRQSNGQYKLAAGWLIDKLGYKGFVHKGVGVHEHQALVLIRYPNGNSTALLELARMIQEDVHKAFSVQLNIEPRIL